MKIENRAKGTFDILIKDNLDIFDEKQFSQDNIEWALATVDSKVLYGKWLAFLIPMLDHVSFAESTADSTKIFNPEVNKENNTIKVFAQNKFAKDDLITENMNMTNEKFILNYNQIITNKKKDCFSISLNFSTNKEDQLATMRAKFYQKYFLFDSNSQYLM